MTENDEFDKNFPGLKGKVDKICGGCNACYTDEDNDGCCPGCNSKYILWKEIHYEDVVERCLDKQRVKEAIEKLLTEKYGLEPANLERNNGVKWAKKIIERELGL